MEDGYTTVYLRKSMHVGDPASISSMIFTVDYDDGFVAFINGVEVARSTNVAAGQNQNTSASPGHSASVEGGAIDDIDITAYKTAMIPGENIFAIEVHNAGISSSDLTMIPEMIMAGGVSEPIGRITATPEVLDFGDVPVGSHADLAFNIENTGFGEDLVVESLEITGLSKSAFSIISPPDLPFILAPGSPARTITVRFEPGVYAKNYASVSIGNSDPDLTIADVSLMGTGTMDAEVSLSALGGVGGVCNAVVADSSNLFVAQGAMLTILDASDPSALQLVGQVRLTDIIQDIAVVGNTAYTAIGASGIQAVDVANLSAPVALAVVDTPGHAYELASSESTLCVADGPSGLLIYNISATHTPANSWMMTETMLDVLTANLTDDTTVNLQDFVIMAKNWLDAEPFAP